MVAGDGVKYFTDKEGLKKSIEHMKNQGARVAYLVNMAESLHRGSIKMEDDTKSLMYNSLAKSYLEVDDNVKQSYGEKLSFVFGDAANHFGKEGDKPRRELFGELSEDAMSHRDRNLGRYVKLEKKVKDHHIGIGQKSVAVLLCGGLIFAMRTMTGNVVSSPVSVGGEIIGSLFLGALSVGILWLIVAKLSAKP